MFTAALQAVMDEAFGRFASSLRGDNPPIGGLVSFNLW